MKVRRVVPSDKDILLEFCKNTFSWGDYVQDVWDTWLVDGIILVVEEDTRHIPVGFCHIKLIKKHQENGISPKVSYLWLEGIRIHPRYRGYGYGTKLAREAEKIALQSDCESVKMVVSSSNLSSLGLAKKLSYKGQGRWRYFSFKAHTVSKVEITQYQYQRPPYTLIQHNKINSESIDADYYVIDWRWIKLTKDDEQLESDKTDKLFITLLSYQDPCSKFEHNHTSFYDSKKEKQSIQFNQHRPMAVGVVISSMHSQSSINATILRSKTMKDFFQLKQFIQNYAYHRNFNRIQVFVPESVLEKFSDKQKTKEVKDSSQFVLLSKQL